MWCLAVLLLCTRYLASALSEYKAHIRGTYLVHDKANGPFHEYKCSYAVRGCRYQVYTLNKCTVRTPQKEYIIIILVLRLY